MNDSSNRIGFNVTEPLSFTLLFSINGQPTDYPNFPNPGNLINAKRGEQLNLSVTLIDESDMSPASGEIVEFYDYTNGDVIIGTDITDSFGEASILYNIGNTNKSGPSLVYAKFGADINYSYYIVNESIWINVISFSDPLELDLAGKGPTQFNIQCDLTDSFNNLILYSQLDLRMNTSIDYTIKLTPSNPEYPILPGSNSFNFNRGVFLDTFVNNYTLTIEFNGDFNLISFPYPAIFNLAYLSNSSVLTRELRVYDDNDVKIYLAVEGNPTTDFYDNSYKPERYTRGQTANFDVNITHIGINPPASGEYVTIWDDYSNILLGNYTFPGGTGFVQFNIPTNNFYYAGIHKIKVQFMDFPTINTTFIIINESVSVNVNPIININNKVVRDDDSFTISGFVKENGTGLRGLVVNLLLFNNSQGEDSQYLLGIKTTSTLANGYFQFNLNSIALNCPQGLFDIRVDFNGSIYLNEVPGINLIPNYMVTNSSLLVPLNITAGTIIIQDTFHTTPNDISEGFWYVDDTLFVYGNLTWDNGTVMTSMKVNVTVQLLDSTIVAFNDTVFTDIYGGFNASLLVDGSWPNLVSQVKIIVYFEPEDNNLVFVEKTELQFT